ncbi:MAG TPA: hypothetical protein VFL71_23080 [Actinomycetes bacterium]|nr:hypothetical protein [Actinomycetes bacterium]
MRSPRRLPSAPTPAQPRWRALAGVAVAGLAVGCALLALQFARLGWVPTAPFVVGTSWGLDEALAARHVQVRVTPGNGYDGQWFLGLAHDPLLREHLADGFDMPRYRAGRPLQAFAGWLLAGGRAGALAPGLLAVGPLAVGLGCAASGRLLAAGRRSPWWGLGLLLGLYGLVPAGELLARFLSSMRALAPTVLAGCLALATAAAAREAARWRPRSRRSRVP